MLRFLKTNNPLIVLFIPLILVIQNVNNFGNSLTFKNIENFDFFAKTLISILPESIIQNTIVIINILLLTAISFSLMFLIKKVNLFRQNNHLIGFIFIFISDIYIPTHTSISLLISALVFILVILLILDTYKEQKAIFQFFNIAFILSVTVIINQVMFVFIFVVFGGLLLLRPMIWREWVASVIGFLVPVFLFLSLNFIIGNNISDIFSNKNIFVNNMENISLPYIYFIILVAFLIIISTISIYSIFPSLNIETRNIMKLFFGIFVISAIAYSFSFGKYSEFMMFIAIPLSIPITFLFNNIKKKLLGEVLFLLLIVLLVFAEIDINFIETFKSILN